MPRSVQEILDHADEFAKRFENADPDPEDVADAAPLRELRDALLARNAADKAIADAIKNARREKISWAAIGGYLGTTGEAARQKYGSLVSS